MNKRIRKFVYEYSQNSRIRTKELGKKLKISQQSASYLISSFKQKKTIRDSLTIFDPARLGFLSVIVYYTVADLSSRNLQEIVSFLREKEEAVGIELLEQGYDIVCTFSVPNLSHFNKVNRDFLQKFQMKLFVAGIYPIIVTHIYPKNYLLPRKQASEMVIGGDRNIVEMSDNEKKLARHFYLSSLSTVIEVSRSLGLNPKTVIKLKSYLETKKVIRSYSVLWDYASLGISRRYFLFSSNDFSLQDDRKLVQFCFQHPNIVTLTRLIGTYDLLVEVEGENLNNKDVLKEIRSEFGIRTYKVLPVGDSVKQKYVSFGVF